MASESDQTRRESGRPGGGQGRRDETGKSGIYPMSGPWPEGDAPIQPMASFGQGARGAEGYGDSGTSGMEDAAVREGLRRAMVGGAPALRRCGDVMSEDPAFCEPGDSVRRAAQLMRSKDVGAIPVVADAIGRRLMGIITDRDLAVKVVAESRDADAINVGAVMTPEPVACGQDDELEKAMHVMKAQRIRRVPIVDDEGRLVGVIAQADIARRVPQPEKVAEIVEEISRPR